MDARPRRHRARQRKTRAAGMPAAKLPLHWSADEPPRRLRCTSRASSSRSTRAQRTRLALSCCRQAMAPCPPRSPALCVLGLSQRHQDAEAIRALEMKIDQGKSPCRGCAVWQAELMQQHRSLEAMQCDMQKLKQQVCRQQHSASLLFAAAAPSGDHGRAEELCCG